MKNKSSVFDEIQSWKRPFHRAKAAVAKNYLKLLKNAEVIAITGSVGKTLTQNVLASALSQKFNVVVGDENLDPTFRIPQTILKAMPWHQKIILEYGVEHAGDMDYYLSLAKPKYAIITKIAPTHLKHLKNIEGVLDEKSKLIKSLTKNDYAFLNADDPYTEKLKKLTPAQIIYFGQKAKNGVKISHYKQDLHGAGFRLHYRGHKATVNWKLLGEHQLMAAYIAAQLGLSAGLTLKQIARGLCQAQPPKHRLNLTGNKKFQIIDDTYNSSPEAALSAIKTLTQIAKNKNKIIVLGEMKDLGADSEKFHTEIGKKIAKTSINFLITIGSAASAISQSAARSQFRGKVVNVKNTNEATRLLKQSVKPKSVILVKGSRHAHLERVVYALQGKPTDINCYHCGKIS